jgi:hypothetical protein
LKGRVVAGGPNPTVNLNQISQQLHQQTGAGTAIATGNRGVAGPSGPGALLSMSMIEVPHHQTAKIPQQYLIGGFNPHGGGNGIGQ